MFLIEFGSSLMQIGYFKLTGGRRIFRCAPIHHDFQYRGFAEPVIVRGFYACGLAAALIGAGWLWLGPQA